MPWVERCSRRTPRRDSSACKRRLTVGCVVCIWAAAADKLPASTMRIKVSINCRLVVAKFWSCMRKMYIKYAYTTTTV